MATTLQPAYNNEDNYAMCVHVNINSPHSQWLFQCHQQTLLMLRLVQLLNLDEWYCGDHSTMCFYRHHNVCSPHTPSWLLTCNTLVLLWQSVDKLLIWHNQCMTPLINLCFLLLRYPLITNIIHIIDISNLLQMIHAHKHKHCHTTYDIV